MCKKQRFEQLLCSTDCFSQRLFHDEGIENHINRSRFGRWRPTASDTPSASRLAVAACDDCFEQPIFIDADFGGGACNFLHVALELCVPDFGRLSPTGPVSVLLEQNSYQAEVAHCWHVWVTSSAVMVMIQGADFHALHVGPSIKP